jgi:hypothetical protein
LAYVSFCTNGECSSIENYGIFRFARSTNNPALNSAETYSESTRRQDFMRPILTSLRVSGRFAAVEMLLVDAASLNMVRPPPLHS